MNDKDREAFEVWFNTNCLDLPTDRRTKIECKADRQALYHNWQRVWQACLEYARKENKELLEKCEDVCDMAEKWFSKDFSKNNNSVPLKELRHTLAALNAAGIGNPIHQG